MCLCKPNIGELTAVRPHKALMIPQGDFNQISNHVFDNNIAGVVRQAFDIRLLVVQQKSVTVTPSGTAKKCHCKRMAYTLYCVTVSN